MSFYVFVNSQIWLYQLLDIITSSATSQIEETNIGSTHSHLFFFFFLFFFIVCLGLPIQTNLTNKKKKKGPPNFCFKFFLGEF